MENELQAITPEGRELVSMAEFFAAQFAPNAAYYDKLGMFPVNHLDALKSAGFLAAPAPLEAGGMGVESVHDLMIASSRLARGDASLTLGVNMHLLVMLSFARQRRAALRRGDERRAAAVTATLAELVAGGAFVAAAISEPDQDLLRPQTTAELRGENWVLNGRKIISSGSPAATHFTVSCTVRDADGCERYAYTLVPRNLPGVTVLDDWDSLGMRASGSNSVVFEDVVLPGRGPGKGAPANVLTVEHFEQIMASGPAHSAAALGVAEAGHRAAIDMVCRKRARQPEKPVSAFIQERAFENSVDLAAARAVFARANALIDQYDEEHAIGRGNLEDISVVFAEVQRAKAFVNGAAVRILDRSMAIAGGAGYSAANPISRLYRDARAGAFMHPLGINVATGYVGAFTLGMRPKSFAA